MSIANIIIAFIFFLLAFGTHWINEDMQLSQFYMQAAIMMMLLGIYFKLWEIDSES